MALSGSKTTTTSGPSAAAMPHLNAATSAITGAYNSTQPTANAVGSSLFDQFKAFSQPAAADPNLTASSDYIGRVLGGEFLNGNPELENIIGTTNNSVADKVNAIFSNAGQRGSSRQIGELGARLAENESGLRYKNYSDEQARIGQAIAQALAMRQQGTSEDSARVANLLALGQGAVGIPLTPAQSLASGTGSLWGNAQTQTTTQGGNLLGQLLNAGASIGSAALMASDRRLKTDIVRVGSAPDGLGIYQYRYAPAPPAAVAALIPQSKGGDPVHTGVMADEVERLRPWALGPEVDGYQTVDYGKL